MEGADRQRGGAVGGSAVVMGGADVSVSRAPRPTCIFKELLLLLPLLRLLHANYRGRR